VDHSPERQAEKIHDLKQRVNALETQLIAERAAKARLEAEVNTQAKHMDTLLARPTQMDIKRGINESKGDSVAVAAIRAKHERSMITRGAARKESPT